MNLNTEKTSLLKESASKIGAFSSKILNSKYCPHNFLINGIKSFAGKHAESRYIGTVISKTAGAKKVVQEKVPKKVLAFSALTLAVYLHIQCFLLLKGFYDYDSQGHKEIKRIDEIPKISKRLDLDKGDANYGKAVNYLLEEYPDFKKLYELKLKEAGKEARISFFYDKESKKLYIQVCKQNICQCSNKLIDTTTVFEANDLKLKAALKQFQNKK